MHPLLSRITFHLPLSSPCTATSSFSTSLMVFVPTASASITVDYLSRPHLSSSTPNPLVSFRPTLLIPCRRVICCFTRQIPVVGFVSKFSPSINFYDDPEPMTAFTPTTTTVLPWQRMVRGQLIFGHHHHILHTHPCWSWAGRWFRRPHLLIVSLSTYRVWNDDARCDGRESARVL